MKQILLVLFSLLLISCSNRIDQTVPELTFVATKVAILSPAKGAVRYVMRYELAEDTPDGFFAKISYQDLSDKSLTHTSLLGGLGEVKALNYNSMPVPRIYNNQSYQITLSLYRDHNYNDVVGVHTDLLRFEMSQTVAEMLQITLL